MWLEKLTVSQRNLILPTGLVILIGLMLVAWSLVGRIFKKKPGLVKLYTGLVVIGMLFLTSLDLGFYFHKLTPFSPLELVYPKTAVLDFVNQSQGIDRFWGYGSGYVEANFSIMTKNYGTDGYEPLFIKRYGELISASSDGKVDKVIPRSDVTLTGGYGPDALRSNPYRQRLLNLLGVKYLLHKNEIITEAWQPDEQTFPPETYQLVWQEAPWQVYENLEALPRAFLIYQYEAIDSDQAMIDRLMDPEFDLKQTLLLEVDPDLPENDLTEAEGVVEVENYSFNQVTIKVQTDQPGLLFLSDNYYPNWQAKVEDQPVEVLRANYSFRAVSVPQGEYLVTFYYQPDYQLKSLTGR